MTSMSKVLFMLFICIIECFLNYCFFFLFSCFDFGLSFDRVVMLLSETGVKMKFLGLIKSLDLLVLGQIEKGSMDFEDG